MFTGLIEHIGTVSEYNKLDESSSGGNGVSLTVTDALPILVDAKIGDSIAINGTCLTVTELINASTFKVGISSETIRKTNLGELHESSKVNLERAMDSDVRFGGHMVQGHVDTIAKIVSREKEDNSIIFTFQLRTEDDEEKKLVNYIVKKGFICLDGTSLTVTDVDYTDYTFKIMMIKHTQERVIMPLKSIGDYVNVEVDLVGKLIERQIENQLENLNESSPLAKFIVSIVDKRIKELVH
ncbi:riboflavin synthase [Ascoidea rubescens DSM 1968]|uniref:Riboflavin synthase n=1 Tax=Ascoidea rubescens DSM 1968 TaxID=1344418 RepID=A0A1D2VRY2_9ASCO|nr:Lumazine-binding protein [Ascoidea rubescens DSM 1968]ODV64374.1 Lumazine-binding protein [Ascoidea rubescens DSM 1968]